MNKLTKTLCATAIAVAMVIPLTAAQAWGPWGGGGPWSNGWGNDSSGEGWGDGSGDMDFSMSGSGHGSGYGRGSGYGGYPGAYGAPYGYAPQAAALAQPAAPAISK